MTYLLTGATSGLGFEVLKTLLSENHKVYAVGRDFTLFESIKHDVNQIIKLKIDLTKLQDLNNIFNEMELNNDKFDGFINCAGFEETIPLKQYDHNLTLEIFQVNVLSTIEILKSFILKKNSNEGSSIVLISSVMGNLGQMGKVGYCSSKAAINGLVKSSALEFAKRKIRINSISPGIIETTMADKLFKILGEKKYMEIKNSHPLGFGSPKDIIPMIALLLSNDSKWITGTDIIIDGGYSIQ